MKSVHFILVGLLLLAVAVVFFAPSTDLEPTALRASQAARALELALVSAALALSLLLHFACFCLIREGSDLPLAGSDLVTLNCARLC